ncbi:MAG: hypothetical protein M1827_005808 [Pycnora praestabilis]|nr:MAG: hypothetical protein M1827_005808 [Pycnora praestabilis]
MHLIITGATGLVGSAVLHHALQLSSQGTITKLSVLSRRPIPMTEAASDPHVKVILNKDYNNYSSQVLELLKDADGVVWALGVSANDVSKADYVDITYNYPIAFAKAIATHSTASSVKPLNFVYVSGEGATTKPGMITAYFGKIKGQAEEALLRFSQQPEGKRLCPFSVRPAAVDPSAQAEIQPYIPKLTAWWRVALVPPLVALFRTVYSDMVSPTRELGKVLVELAMGDGQPLKGEGISGEGRTINNKALRRLAGI